MFKRTRIFAAAAFGFGLAFSFAAFAQAEDCQSCTDECYVQYEQCNADGYPFCKSNLRACLRACGCSV